MVTLVGNNFTKVDACFSLEDSSYENDLCVHGLFKYRNFTYRLELKENCHV